MSRKTKKRHLRVVASNTQLKSKAQMPPRLLYSRRQTAHVLATSYTSVMRLEQRGLLTPVRLNATTHYRCDQVHALAEGGER
jgi:hypothetical protein